MQFTVDELLEMGRGVSSGMKCLSEMGFVHRVSYHFYLYYYSILEQQRCRHDYNNLKF